MRSSLSHRRTSAGNSKCSRTGRRSGTRAGNKKETVVLVHGIWMHGVMMRFLGERLRSDGYQTVQVSYDFLKQSPAENAECVFADIRSIDTDIMHLVGHSLGGIVILHLLSLHPELKPGKVVLIGSPVRGSNVARQIHDNPVLRVLLGRSVEKGLLGGAPEYTANRPVGVITGAQRFGLVAPFVANDEPNDGAVSESETQLSGTEVRINVPYSHSMMIFSRRCASLVSKFLQTGRFD